MKKFLVIFIALLFANSANAWTNDLRSLFQNDLANILVINIRTFSAVDSDKNGIVEPEKGEVVGTFTGAAKRLGLLRQHGINTVHLLPITPVGKLKALGTAGSLYAMDEFSVINPQLDDLSNPLSVEEEAKMFVEEAHKKGIRVIVDLPSCGSYDLYLRKPELFAKNKDGQPIIPADWTDVRLFKTQEADGSVNEELFQAHKDFVDMVKRIGADGIRADVATIKPYEFWQMLISYARKDDAQFLFLAEASPAWTEPVSKDAVFTPYDKLVSAGFDGYLGNFTDYEKFLTAADLFKSYKTAKDLSKRYNSEKSIVLNFATHDDISPILVNLNYPSQLLWLAATLPGNMYFVNGFMTNDAFLYPYSNKEAEKTYTDDNTYYVHKGKLDIFNFSRRPGGMDIRFSDEYIAAVMLKQQFSNLLKTEPNILKTSDKNIFAYEYSFNNNKLIVILNHNPSMDISGTVSYKGVSDFDELVPLKMPNNSVTFEKGKFDVKLAPSDIIIFMSNNQYSQKK